MESKFNLLARSPSAHSFSPFLFWLRVLGSPTKKDYRQKAGSLNPNPSTGGPRLASNCKKITWQSSKAIHGVKLGRVRLRIGLRGFGPSTSATALITIHACVLAESNAESGR